MGTIGRIIGFALLGALVAPALTLILMALIYIADARCGDPSDSGGCEMSMAMTVLASSPVGAALGLIFGIWKSLRRRA